jgi:hypothetical protein
MLFVRRAPAAGLEECAGGSNKDHHGNSGSSQTQPPESRRILPAKRQILSLEDRAAAGSWRGHPARLASFQGNSQFPGAPRAGTGFEKGRHQEGCRHGSSGTDGRGGNRPVPPLFFVATARCARSRSRVANLLPPFGRETIRDANFSHGASERVTPRPPGHPEGRRPEGSLSAPDCPLSSRSSALKGSPRFAQDDRGK